MLAKWRPDKPIGAFIAEKNPSNNIRQKSVKHIRSLEKNNFKKSSIRAYEINVVLEMQRMFLLKLAERENQVDKLSINSQESLKVFKVNTIQALKKIWSNT